MNFEAIQHIPMSQQAHGIDPNHVVFRLRAGRDDLKHCTLFYADRACRLTPVIFSSVEMQVEAQDEWFDYFQVILESPYKRICYYFELDDGTQKLLYYGDFFTDHRVDDRSEYYQLPFNHPADIAAPPAWAQDAQWFTISSQIALPRVAALSLANHPKKSGTVRLHAENSAERCAA